MQLVGLPDLDGRYEVFKVHLKPLNISEDLMDKYAKRLATITPGFSGSDIANICNEAAILAARNKRTQAIPEDFENAVDRVLAGLEMKRLPSKKSIRKVAVHESGHGAVAWFLEGGNPLLKLTIVPRSKGALGFAQYLPPENSLQTEQELRDAIAVALGGRIAEEVFFGEVTTGAADDLQKVYKYASSLVLKLGMSTKLGYVAYPDSQSGDRRYSEEMSQLIDEEIHKVIKEAEETARRIITEKKDLITQLSDKLLEKETIDINDVQAILGPRPFEIKGNFKKYLEEKQKFILEA